jgi:hypothetical protein
LIEKHLRTNQGLVVSAPQLHKYRKDDEEFAQGSFTGNGNLNARTGKKLLPLKENSKMQD